jgi:Trk K+ transport system NAD-binding subunit
MSAVLIAGQGHLADRLAHLLGSTQSVRRVASAPRPALAALEEALSDAGIASATALYIVDDNDAANIPLALAALKLNPTLPIAVSLSSASLAKYLQSLPAGLRVVNPWASVAPEIARALREPATGGVRSAPALPPPHSRPSFLRENRFLIALAAAFVAILLGATLFFRSSEGLDWVSTLYFVVTMATTTGFGDISLRNSSSAAKVVGMVTMVSAIAFISVFFSLLVDRIVVHRTAQLLGRRRYRLAGHVVLCGLGKIGYHLVERLHSDGYPLIVIEKDPESRFLGPVRARGVPVMIADATVPRNLADAAAGQASAVVSVVNDDLVNLEVGLNARSIQPNIRVVLRIFDRDTAHEIRRQFNIHYTVSSSAMAAEAMLRSL